MYKEKVQKLLDAIKNQPNNDKIPLYLKFVEDNLKNLPNYVNAVVMMQFQTMIAHVKYEDNIKEFQDIVSNLDRRRRLEHLALVASINGLNRLSGMVNTEPLFYQNY